MDDNRLAKIAKDGKPNIFRPPELRNIEGWILTSQENRHTA